MSSSPDTANRPYGGRRNSSTGARAREEGCGTDLNEGQDVHNKGRRLINDELVNTANGMGPAGETLAVCTTGRRSPAGATLGVQQSH